MKIVGLTGGIGSGKSTVAGFFIQLGVAVYFADEEAKKLMNSSKTIRNKLIQLLGGDAFKNKELNRTYVAEKIFSDEELLQKVNNIVHPEVALHFKKCVKQQKGSYCIKEAAILFESGSYHKCDVIILVKAPEDVRIARVIERDKTTKEEVSSIMAHQWPDSKKEKLADIIIENINLSTTRKRVQEIHLILQ